MAQQLLLVRHGLIDANRQGLWHGSTDSPLLPKGERQAQRAGVHIAGQAALPVAIYTSPLQRCRTTAELISGAINGRMTRLQRWQNWRGHLHRLSAGTLGAPAPAPAQQHTPIEPVVVDDLREYAIGDWEGMSFSDLARDHQFPLRTTTELDYSPPAGESLRQVSQRSEAALRDLHSRHGPDERILIVAHGVVLAVGLATILNKDPSKWVDYHFDNCGISELTLNGLPELQRLNMTEHL